MERNTLQVARSWVAAGFSVIPLQYRSKRPAFDALKCVSSVDQDQRPIWEPFTRRVATDAELYQWFAGPRRNLGVVTGFNGLVVIDFDDTQMFGAWMEWARVESGQATRIAASTYRVFSARGVHVYLRASEPIESYKLPGIDVKGAFGYVLAPPSVHPCGHEYYAVGASIARCERLADVFPLKKPAPEIIEASTMAITNDPWESANRAVECGGAGSIEVAKSRLRLADLVQVTHEDRGGAWAACPLHSDWNPSLRLYEDGHAHCFQCDFHGDVIDLYAAIHRLSNREAIAALSGR